MLPAFPALEAVSLPQAMDEEHDEPPPMLLLFGSLGMLPALRQLSMFAEGGYIDGLPALARITQLTSLDIYSEGPLEDATPLTALTGLRRLKAGNLDGELPLPSLLPHLTSFDFFSNVEGVGGRVVATAAGVHLDSCSYSSEAPPESTTQGYCRRLRPPRAPTCAWMMFDSLGPGPRRHCCRPSCRPGRP
ncbi:hypothetical protein ABPG75_012999 [Micractinium tetrahymenae]